MSFDIPPSLRWLSARPDGAAWLNRLPDLLREVSAAWDLRPAGQPLDGNVSYVVPVWRGDGRFALKIQWPHDECRHEADALRHWDGDGAVRLVDQDLERHALLLEWCDPGTRISEAQATDPLGVIIGLLRRLGKPADRPFRSLADEARSWRAGLGHAWEAAGKPCERALVDAARTRRRAKRGGADG